MIFFVGSFEILQILLLERFDIHGIDNEKQFVGTYCPSEITVIPVLDVEFVKIEEPVFYVPDQPTETIVVYFRNFPKIVLCI